jgi:Sulfotransferase family
MIDHDRRFVFVHIPKTGGTSLIVALYATKEKRTHTPFRVYERGMVSYLARRSIGAMAEQEMRALFKEKAKELLRSGRLASDLSGYRSFSIVRNPWDRTVSWYKNVVRDERHWRRLHVDPSIDFASFVRRYLHVHWALRPQTYWLNSWSGEIGVERVFHLEDAPQLWTDISRYIGVPIPTIHQGAASDRRPYHEFYDTETRDLVAAAYATEIARFGYTFSDPPREVYPAGSKSAQVA